MGIKTLLPLNRTPHLNTVLYKPLHNEWRFIFTPTKAIEHKDQQHIKFTRERVSADLEDGVSFIGTLQIAGHTLLGYLFQNDPARMLRNKFPAGDPLHRNVIVIDLACRRYPIQAYNALQQTVHRLKKGSQTTIVLPVKIV